MFHFKQSKRKFSGKVSVLLPPKFSDCFTDTIEPNTLILGLSPRFKKDDIGVTHHTRLGTKGGCIPYKVPLTVDPLTRVDS